MVKLFLGQNISTIHTYTHIIYTYINNISIYINNIYKYTYIIHIHMIFLFVKDYDLTLTDTGGLGREELKQDNQATSQFDSLSSRSPGCDPHGLQKIKVFCHQQSSTHLRAPGVGG